MRTYLSLAAAPLLVLPLVACGSNADPGWSATSTSALSGCHGTASSAQPGDGAYYLTSFGFTPSDDGVMSCGEYTKHGSWYYAASRQRFGCGARIQITANGKCVVAETDDYGPDVCVEKAAGAPIIDASPLVSEHLFGTQSAGWSDRLPIQVQVVDASTPLGICDGKATADAGSGAPGDDAGSPPLATCVSATLGETVTAGTCVQARSNSVWYQCTPSGWESGGDGSTGPLGPCTAAYPLQ